MPTRRFFIVASAAAASWLSGFSQVVAQAAEPKPAVTPTPKPSASPGPEKPSRLARELAFSLQRDLPEARLADSTTDQIASDIQTNFSIGAAFRKHPNDRLPPPDFVFAAATEDRP